MQLKIYKISHPVLKIIMNQINETHIKQSKQEYYSRYIGFLMIYEILRRYIKIQNLYIKIIEGTKTIEEINQNRRYIILTDISQTYNMITDIKSLISNIEVFHIDYKNNYDIKKSMEKINLDIKDAYIFIIERITEDYKVLDLINILHKNQKILIKNIVLGNIFINDIILKTIGNQYPEMTVYTTKINYYGENKNY
uniref:Uracil phosphoribosyltransferase n=1 Tax=Polysiphonia sertularioides TaxID=945028 RepID=A0A1Z1M907_9FLOR|nr:uracil phosphoribosyltransferase [Polysiphonia sertularioides]ARW62587.1 uracil phosphoribosyltransferase [Polysiphonia sertularioides]